MIITSDFFIAMMEIYLKETAILNYSDSAIQKFVETHTNDMQTETEKAVALFYAVRDGFLYNPYYINTDKEELKASKVIERGFGHCIDKASLLIACLRNANIPARIGLAKVKNHIATERLEEYLGSNILTPHGYVEVWLGNSWWKITPAFNQRLCEKLGVANLEFNGRNHCLFQEFDEDGSLFMEYLEDYGHFEDIPIRFIVQNMLENYPNLSAHNSEGISIDLGMLEL